jgi:hypothetical protein
MIFLPITVDGSAKTFDSIHHGLPGTGRICLIRSLVVRRLLTGGTEKGLSFSYSQSMFGVRCVEDSKTKPLEFPCKLNGKDWP